MTKKKPIRRLPKFALSTPSRRSFAQEEALVRQAQANRREATGHYDLAWLPAQPRDDSKRLMKFQQPPRLPDNGKPQPD